MSFAAKRFGYRIQCPMYHARSYCGPWLGFLWPHTGLSLTNPADVPQPNPVPSFDSHFLHAPPPPTPHCHSCFSCAGTFPSLLLPCREWPPCPGHQGHPTDTPSSHAWALTLASFLSHECWCWASKNSALLQRMRKMQANQS